ncbi:MAG: hypothetical protein H7343_24170 [Undibacterium sp.]|nr:hypothetical protein [Opitutaceae bacterium]
MLLGCGDTYFGGGVPESVVRDIIGHEKELVSREYTHLDDETKRNTIRKMPVLV